MPASYERRFTNSQHAESGRNMKGKFSRIQDNYSTLGEVTKALRKSGLEAANLIVGIDFTKSNEWTGKHSFNGKNLHALDANRPNPYEHAITIIGSTLASFDDDNLIPCFGFGDVTTNDQNVFSFFTDRHPCDSFEGALKRYRELVPQVKLAGPTSFAPIIKAATDIVANSKCQYHVLLILADGQVTRSVDTEPGQLSAQEQSTVEAIVAASEFPLSIVLIGVGDGPWDMMEEFDDNICDRAFDNFQFVNFTGIMSRKISPQRKEAAFALAALMEIPSQFRACIKFGLLNRLTERVPIVDPLPPPVSPQHDNASLKYAYPGSSSSSPYQSPFTADEEAPQSNENLQLCPVCWVNPKNMAFGCGHQTCQTCAETLITCPICRQEITFRLRLY